MDKIEKLFRKISKKDRVMLKGIISNIVVGSLDKLDIKKIVNTDFFRVKAKKYRIIYHLEKEEFLLTYKDVSIYNYSVITIEKCLFMSRLKKAFFTVSFLFFCIQPYS